MDPEFGLACSSVNLRGEPNLKSHVIEALDPQDHLQVIEDAGDMYKVQATKWHPPVTGYALKSAVFVDRLTQEIFPRVVIKAGLAIPAVPPSLPLSTFLSWLDSGKESPWLPTDYSDAIQAGQQPPVGSVVRQVISDHCSDWDAWIGEIQAQGRLATAAIDEWLVIMAGGRPMWTRRTERIFSQPTEHTAAPAWVSPQDVLRWTGHVRFNDQEPKYKTWYEVELTKLDQRFKGWYKASLLEEFILPMPATDLAQPDNARTIFDLSRPRLRIPADPEIEAARRAGRTGAQYIEISRAIGVTTVKHNLCGEFCAAALGGSDVIPFLQQWLTGSAVASPILGNDYGTSITDLQTMLDVFNKKYEFFRAETSVAPITPAYLRKMLDSGRMAIVGTGITYNGIVKWGSRIRHWIIIEDIVRVGNSGWVRIYNPFPDREEVYPFDVVFDTVSRSAIGLWVEPTLLQ
ncbi:MAG: SH3 domain-containing protein [Anaerolineales bacterium]